MSLCAAPLPKATVLLVGVALFPSSIENPTTLTPSAPTIALLGGLLTVRRTLISYQGALRTISPQRQLLDEKAASHLLAFLLDALDHSNHNVVTGSLEALQQLLKILKRDLIPWFREPGRCDRLVLALPVPDLPPAQPAAFPRHP